MNGTGCIDMRRMIELAFGIGFHAWCLLQEVYAAARRRVIDNDIFNLVWFIGLDPRVYLLSCRRNRKDIVCISSNNRRCKRCTCVETTLLLNKDTYIASLRRQMVLLPMEIAQSELIMGRYYLCLLVVRVLDS